MIARPWTHSLQFDDYQFPQHMLSVSHNALVIGFAQNPAPSSSLPHFYTSFSHCPEGPHSSDSPGELLFHLSKLIWVPPSMCIFSCYLQAVLGHFCVLIACNTIFLSAISWRVGSGSWAPLPAKSTPCGYTKSKSVLLETDNRILVKMLH